MSFDAPVVLALAPLVGGAVWFAAAWARRVRIRRAALWSEDTVRRALGAGRLGPTALSVAAFLGVVALAGPRWGEEQIVGATRGSSLVMAVNCSGPARRSPTGCWSCSPTARPTTRCRGSSPRHSASRPPGFA